MSLGKAQKISIQQIADQLTVELVSSDLAQENVVMNGKNYPVHIYNYSLRVTNSSPVVSNPKLDTNIGYAVPEMTYGDGSLYYLKLINSPDERQFNDSFDFKPGTTEISNKLVLGTVDGTTLRAIRENIAQDSVRFMVELNAPGKQKRFYFNLTPSQTATILQLK